jgi:hypothetical protein
MIELEDSSPSTPDRDDSPNSDLSSHRRTGSGQYTPVYGGTDSRYHRRRSSAFFEVGLGGDDPIVDAKIRRNSRPRQQVRFRSKVDVHEVDQTQWAEENFDCLTTRPQLPTVPWLFPLFTRWLFLSCIFLLGLQSWNDGVSPIGAKAGPSTAKTGRSITSLPAKAGKRANSPTDICVRWSGQSAVVNGTLYYYGGRASQTSGQTENTWSRLS